MSLQRHTEQDKHLPSGILSSLRSRLLLLTALSVIPLLALILANARSERERIAATVQSDALQLTRFVAANQSEHVAVSRQLLLTLSQVPEIQGQPLQGCNSLLADLTAQFPYYTNLYTVDANGDSACSGLPAEPGSINVAGKAWFQRVRETGSFVVGSYELGPLTGRPVVPLAHPLYDSEGTFVGAVGAGLSLDWLGDFLAQTPLDAGSTLTILDEEGSILAVYPQDEQNQSFIGQNATQSPIVQEALAQGEGVTRGPGLLQIPRLYGFTSVGEPGSRIFIVLSVPESEAFSSVNTFERQSLMALGAVSGLVFLLAWVASGPLLLRPIQHLVDATSRLAKGDLSTRVEGHLGIRELDRLANAFNAMATALEIRNAELAQEIEQHKGAEENLKRFAAQLESSNQELEQFAYVASHDLQEPLRVVAGYLQLLERRYKDKLDSDANDFIDFAVDGAKRMQTLINDLLAYSRIGRKTRPFEPTDCNAVLAQALVNLKVLIEDNNAVVTQDPLPTVQADGWQLMLVFQNLIANGVKFRRDEPVRVHVGVRECPGEWEFSVQDNGIGIDPQYKERIFLIFQRLHTREEYAGTGIGLAICQKIVEYHGGRIWLESMPEQGTTFFFTLPKDAKEPA